MPRYRIYILYDNSLAIYYTALKPKNYALIELLIGNIEKINLFDMNNNFVETIK